MPPNASRHLIRWGLGDQMEAVCSKPSRINYRSWRTGQPQGFTNMADHLQKYGAPYWQVYRPDYHGVLFDAAVRAGVAIRKGQTVVAYRPDRGEVVLETGEVVRGDLVVAADGVKSIAREAMGLDVEPHETGDTCFRVVIPQAPLLKDPELAPLSLDPNFEQILGPDHHIIGSVSHRKKGFAAAAVDQTC